MLEKVRNTITMDAAMFQGGTDLSVSNATDPTKKLCTIQKQHSQYAEIDIVIKAANCQTVFDPVNLTCV